MGPMYFGIGTCLNPVHIRDLDIIYAVSLYAMGSVLLDLCPVLLCNSVYIHWNYHTATVACNSFPCTHVLLS